MPSFVNSPHVVRLTFASCLFAQSLVIGPLSEANPQWMASLLSKDKWKNRAIEEKEWIYTKIQAIDFSEAFECEVNVILVMDVTVRLDNVEMMRSTDT